MTVRAAASGNYLDTDAVLLPSVCATIAQAGFTGVVRYVPLPGNRTTYDVSGLECGGILDASLYLLLVQHVRYEGWAPAAHSGRLDAKAATDHALGCGYPLGCHVYQDLEGVTGTAIQILSYCADWAHGCQDAGYLAGLYVGYDNGLSPEALYSLPHTTYWKAPGPWQVAHRGFAMTQGPEIYVSGIKFDRNVCMPDTHLETPMACVA